MGVKLTHPTVLGLSRHDEKIILTYGYDLNPDRNQKSTIGATISFKILSCLVIYDFKCLHI